ncbi:uncharacterized protein MELLADRAFT_64493 [Melampsora larici-populina 98AG31]|uniref:Uncharacterized protein n=1 Tax=Melampsora larici-populina (strain 98AG31 / pathotype 3-4-7) TaxID=747676 RepID=F4RRN2_MELLP|nr:uncharacterized protein MELLADRAFT_64493 [Melampsora larici-populina 98AG31]EGG04991.1 hypothetical protein MELLADRAFT_64493 [Melampsora larici-populina 98AG31]
MCNSGESCAKLDALKHHHIVCMDQLGLVSGLKHRRIASTQLKQEEFIPPWVASYHALYRNAAKMALLLQADLALRYYRDSWGLVDISYLKDDSQFPKAQLVDVESGTEDLVPIYIAPLSDLRYAYLGAMSRKLKHDERSPSPEYINYINRTGQVNDIVRPQMLATELLSLLSEIYSATMVKMESHRLAIMEFSQNLRWID